MIMCCPLVFPTVNTLFPSILQMLIKVDIIYIYKCYLNGIGPNFIQGKNLDELEMGHTTHAIFSSHISLVMLAIL